MEIISIEQNLLSLVLDKLIEFTLLHSNLYKIPESSAALFTSRPVTQELKAKCHSPTGMVLNSQLATECMRVEIQIGF